MSKNKFTISSILNIDSSFRDKNPKNIYKSNNRYLPFDPLTFEKGKSIITVTYPNHGLSVGDNIIIQNVEGASKILVGSFYLIDELKYLVISIKNDIANDYKKYTDELFASIEIFGDQTEENIINNIPFNYSIGYKKILTSEDIPSDEYVILVKAIQNTPELFSQLTNVLNDFILVELPYKYINKSNSYYKINQTYKITFQHISGIKLGYLNANYPINTINYQSSYQVYNVIDDNTFSINIKYEAYNDTTGGGKNVQVMKIINSITGYPDADNYVINLKKSFNNVTSIELLSTEFPYVDLAIKKDFNDKLYWRNIEDGQELYKVQIDEGFYSTSTLLEKLKNKINQVKRKNYTPTNLLFNYFDIELEANIQKITFKPYNLTKLPNKLSARIEIIENVKYFILSVSHQNNIVDKEDIINISGSDNVTVKVQQDENIVIYSIDQSYINKDQVVYSKNLENDSYDIILGRESEIRIIIVEADSYGGENVLIKSKTKVSFLFDKPDTMGEILGFKNVGDKFSITDFSSELSNQYPYANSNNLDSVGNDFSYPGGFINLAGKYNYMLMYLNDIEYIYSNNNLPSAFAKIAFSGNPGDVLFNTFVPYPINVYSKNFPISTITDISIKFTYPDGTRVNFRNLDHSFTLRITEEKTQNTNTYLNSQRISVAEEFKNANLID